MPAASSNGERVGAVGDARRHTHGVASIVE